MPKRLRKNENQTIEKYQRKVKRFEHRHHILAAMLVGIAIVLLWRGVWELADIYIFPNQDIVSAVVCIVVGFTILYLRDFDLKEFL
jgi:ABC-type Fe3+-siderophore transport system permease subunit